MHDIGKIGIPDQILLKPGKFEPHEWEIMKTHTTIGAEILSGDDSELLSMARVIALSITRNGRQRLSRWSEGDDIPLVGRIVALADVFDALTSVRPYKKAWPVEEAMAYLEGNRGKHFDPRLVDVFRAELPNMLAIKAQHAEPEAARIDQCNMPLFPASG